MLLFELEKKLDENDSDGFSEPNDQLIATLVLPTVWGRLGCLLKAHRGKPRGNPSGKRSLAGPDDFRNEEVTTVGISGMFGMQ